jgi:RNA-directed DNA polymerase
MLDHIPADKEVLRKWLKAGFMENRTLFPTEAGTPQGGIISPTLANLTLDGLERLLKETFRRKEIQGKAYNPKVNFVRYADDFIITGCSKELLEDEVKPLVERFMFERGLQLSPEKTCITHIEQGFDFLGQNLRRYGGKLLITPSKKNMHAFLEKVRGEIRSNRATKQEYLIRLLNPVIRVGHTITVTSKRVRRTGKWEWSSGTRSGDGQSAGIQTSPLPGS